MGRYMREHLPKGYRLHWTGDRYEHRCPVAIVHKRFGFSPALREGHKICSLCGEDVSECVTSKDRMAYSIKTPTG